MWPVAKVSIDKLQAARRQLDVAVELFFHDGDPVAVHALGAASCEILEDLMAHAGVEDDLIAVLLPDYRDRFRALWRAPQNFFKHANRDPNSVLDYETALAGQVLFRACRHYSHFAPVTAPMRVLQIYYCLRHPDVLLDRATREAFLDAPAWMRDASREHFYDVMRDVANAPRADHATAA